MRWFTFRFWDKSSLDEKSFIDLITPWNEEKEERHVDEIITQAFKKLRPDYDPASIEPTEKKPIPNLYCATYEYEICYFEVLRFLPKENGKPRKIYHYDNPWEIFYKHCTFQEILDAVEPNDNGLETDEEHLRFARIWVHSYLS